MAEEANVHLKLWKILMYTSRFDMQDDVSVVLCLILITKFENLFM